MLQLREFHNFKHVPVAMPRMHCFAFYVVAMSANVKIHHHLPEKDRMRNLQVLSLVDGDVDLAPPLYAVSSCTRDNASM